MIKILLFILLSLNLQIAHADFEADLSQTGSLSPAVRELHTHALAGDAIARLNLGTLFFKGQGIGQDYAEAAKWFRLAAQQGIAQAQFNIGLMYDTGQGVSQDHAEAVRWYRLAADQGFALGQLNLGAAYASGQGIVKNDVEAAKWTRLAANQGNAQAQFNLAVMYATGQGVKENFNEAYQWAKLASVQGYKTATALAQDLASHIKNEQAASQPVTQQANPPVAGEYYLQLAAFKSQKEAQDYLTTVQAKLGHNEQSLSIFTSDGWVRTQLGPYSSLNEARGNAARLKTKLGYQPLLKQR